MDRSTWESAGNVARDAADAAGLAEITGFKLDPREIGWADYVMIGGGFGLGLLVLAIAMFLKHA